MAITALQLAGLLNRGRNIIEKNPVRYQESSWFAGSKTLKIISFLLKGA